MALFNRKAGSGRVAVRFNRLIGLFVIFNLLAGLLVAFGPATLKAAPIITLPDGRVHLFYEEDLYACSTLCTFSLTSGTLPPDLDAELDIVFEGLVFISMEGNPIQAGTYSFQLTITDGGPAFTQDYVITILPANSTPGYASDPRPGQSLTIGAKVGKPASTSLLVSETGSADLVISNPQITGDNAAEFSLLSPAFPLTIRDGGAAQSISVQCNPVADGKRKAVLTLTTNDPTQPTVSYALVCGVEEDKKPADLVAQLRVTPDRDASLKPQTEIRFELTVKNVGPGEAVAVRMLFPFDRNLIPAYTRFSDSRMWVSEMVTEGDQPYLKIGMPPVQPNHSFSATLVFHPKTSAKPGTVIHGQFSAGWDDAVHAGKTNLSNSVVVTLVEDKDRDDTKGSVHWFAQHGQKIALGQSLVLTGDFYAPEEAIDFWYSDPSGTSVQLGMFWADKQGKISLEFSTTGLKEGQVYTIVGKGRRSGITGSAALTITAPNSGDGEKPKTPDEGLK